MDLGKKSHPQKLKTVIANMRFWDDFFCLFGYLVWHGLPRPPQRRPRTSQGRPRGVPGRPKPTPEAPQEVPRPPQDVQSPPQRHSRTPQDEILVIQAVPGCPRPSKGRPRMRFWGSKRRLKGKGGIPKVVPPLYEEGPPQRRRRSTSGTTRAS